MLIQTNHYLFEPARAERVAEMLNDSEEERWTYRARHDPEGTGHSVVEIRDESGEFVGLL